MAEPHAHSQPIQTYGPAPHNRNIWPHNSQAAVFCLRFWPILLFFLPPLTHYWSGHSPGRNKSNPSTARNCPGVVTPLAQKKTCSNTRQFILYLIVIIYININYFGGLKRHSKFFTVFKSQHIQ